MNRASGSTCSRSPGRQKNRQSSSKPSGAPSSCSVTFGSPRSGRKLVKAPSRLLHREPQHLAPQRRERRSARGSRGGLLELEAGRRSARRRARRRRKSTRLRDPRQRPRERHPVPALDDPVRGCADPEREAPRLASASAAACWASSAGPRVNDADDAGAEADALGPRRGERQRREPVGAVGLARPEVGVAGTPRRGGRARRCSASGSPGSGRVRPQRCIGADPIGPPPARAAVHDGIKLAPWTSRKLRPLGDGRDGRGRRAHHQPVPALVLARDLQASSATIPATGSAASATTAAPASTPSRSCAGSCWRLPRPPSSSPGSWSAATRSPGRGGS